MTTIKDTLNKINLYLDIYSTDYENNIFQLATIIPICLFITVLKNSCTNNHITLNDTSAFLVNMFNIFVYISILTFNLKKLPILNADASTKDTLYLLTSIANVGTSNVSISLQYLLSLINNTMNCDNNIYNIITTILFGVTNYLIFQVNNITEIVNTYDYTIPLDPTNIYDLEQIEMLKKYSFYSIFSNIGTIISIYILILNFVSNGLVKNIMSNNNRKNIYSILENNLPEN